MSVSIHNRIKVLIEETNDAFSIYDSAMNTDYAEFATLALSDFKHVLRNPKLTRRQLTKMLRSGASKHKNIDPESNWSSFMAHHIETTSNTDDTVLKNFEAISTKETGRLVS